MNCVNKFTQTPTPLSDDSHIIILHPPTPKLLLKLDWSDSHLSLYCHPRDQGGNSPGLPHIHESLSDDLRSAEVLQRRSVSVLDIGVALIVDSDVPGILVIIYAWSSRKVLATIGHNYLDSDREWVLTWSNRSRSSVRQRQSRSERACRSPWSISKLWFTSNYTFLFEARDICSCETRIRRKLIRFYLR